MSPPEHIRFGICIRSSQLRSLWRLRIVGHVFIDGIDHYEKEWYQLVWHCSEMRFTTVGPVYSPRE